MIQYWSRFLYVIKGKRKALLGMLFLFVFVSILETLGAGSIGPFIALATDPDSIDRNQWLRSIYDWFNLDSKSQFLMLIGLLVIAIFYLKAFLSFNIQKYIFEFGFNQQGELSSKLMRAYLAAPYTFHLNRNSANLIQNLIGESERFSTGLMMPLLTSISNVLIISALVLLLVKTDAMAITIIFGILLISLALFHSFRDRIARWGKEGSEARTEMIRSINHSLGALKETRVIGCESYFEHQVRQQIDKYALSSSLALGFSNLPRYVIEAFLITFLIGFTFLFISLDRGNTKNLSSVLGIFALASIRLLPATGNLMTSINVIRYNSNSLDRLYLDLKELEPEKTDRSEVLARSPKSTLSYADRIVLDNVTYSYPNSDREALAGISLTIKKGESIGLIGKSGAGKTTLVDVLLGLLTPQNGDITVDGVSIYKDLRSWQNTIAYVPQSIFLIDDTLTNNIAFGVSEEEIDRQKLRKAIAAAQLNELIEQLPQGMNTMVGERGVMLSGGQRQRVGIARALYHERNIIIFDEATAALDSETENLVTKAIASLSGTKTMIIIAHRLSTLKHCDRVYLMENSRVVKEGSYDKIVLNK
ncbi:MAG: ABC transporter ATP-binding protein [Xenococcaceae cyanobacterium]